MRQGDFDNLSEQGGAYRKPLKGIPLCSKCAETGERTLTENTKKLVEYRLIQARETLQVARELCDHGHYRDAVNRAYYAMFYCGLGLLAAKNLGTSKHSGVLSLFSQHFVKTGQISKETGRHLREAFELRQACDYREFSEISRQQVEEILANASGFLEESRKTLAHMNL